MPAIAQPFEMRRKGRLPNSCDSFTIAMPFGRFYSSCWYVSCSRFVRSVVKSLMYRPCHSPFTVVFGGENLGEHDLATFGRKVARTQHALLASTAHSGLFLLRLSVCLLSDVCFEYSVQIFVQVVLDSTAIHYRVRYVLSIGTPGLVHSILSHLEFSSQTTQIHCHHCIHIHDSYGRGCVDDHFLLFHLLQRFPNARSHIRNDPRRFGVLH